MYCRASDRDGVADVQQHRVQRLGHLQRLVDGVVHQGLPPHPDDAVVLALVDQADGAVAHGGGVDAVPQGGRAAALDVAQNGGAGVDAGAGLDLVGDLLGMADALGDDDDEVVLAGLFGHLDAVEDVALHIELVLGQQHGHGARGDGHVQGDVAGVAAHDLHHAAPVVALGGVAQLVDHLHGGVHGGVVADGVVGAGDVVVDGAGQADHRDAAVGQLAGAAVGAVAADDHQRVDAQLTALGRALVLALLGLELQAAGGVQDGAAVLDDVGDAAQVHLVALAVQQAVVAALDADHPVPLVDAGADDRAHRRIHAGCVAAAGQYADGFDLSLHSGNPPNSHMPFPFYKTRSFLYLSGRGPAAPAVSLTL